MIKKINVLLLAGFLINLFIGQYSNSYSQNVSKLKYSETGNISLNKINNTTVLFDSTFKKEPLVLQPLTSNDLIPQFVLGFGVGNLATLGAAIPIVALTGMSFDPGGGGHTSAFGAITFLFLLASVQVFATAGLVWSAGTNDKVGANFGLTLLGSLAGVGLEIGGIALAIKFSENSGGQKSNPTLAWIFGITGLLMPTVGAMVGLNTTRYPKSISGQPKSLLNFYESNISLSSPFIYLEQDRTLHHKPITFAKLVSFNF
jgi:hypothetical protein